jgi:transcriptional regulator with XRE-family HTH domain
LLIILNIFLNSKKQILFPKHLKILQIVGENIKLARKRRRLTTVQVSERAGINRTTLYLIEKGTASVSMGAYFNVMRVLGLHHDFLKLGSEDKQGRDIQDLKLLGGK